jgi:hypothetical protein
MMRYLNLGYAVVVALVVSLGMLTASASAAKTCSTSGTGAACQSGHGKVYTGAVAASLTFGTNVVLSGSVTVTCKKSSIGGTISSGEIGVGSITSWTFAECSAGILGACTMAVKASSTEPMPLSIETESTSSTDGATTLSAFKIEFTCVGTTCKYEKSRIFYEIFLDGSDTTTAKLLFDSTLFLGTGQPGLCGGIGSGATLTGSYTVSTPDTLMIE